MKLKQWAAVNGISYETAWRWFHQGTLPVPAHQVASGTILIETPLALANGVTSTPAYRLPTSGQTLTGKWVRADRGNRR